MDYLKQQKSLLSFLIFFSYLAFSFLHVVIGIMILPFLLLRSSIPFRQSLFTNPRHIMIFLLLSSCFIPAILLFCHSTIKIENSLFLREFFLAQQQQQKSCFFLCCLFFFAFFSSLPIKKKKCLYLCLMDFSFSLLSFFFSLHG